MLRTDVISDDLWTLIEWVMPSATGRRGRPCNDHRRTLEGIIWRFRTGSPWRDLPEHFGACQSVAERHLGWSKIRPTRVSSPPCVATPASTR
jgi:putative transposase